MCKINFADFTDAGGPQSAHPIESPRPRLWPRVLKSFLHTPAFIMSLTSSTDTSSPAYKKAERQYFKSTSSRSKNVELNWTPFRAAEKKYKARFPPPDLSQVLDVARIDDARADEVARGKWCGSVDAVDFKELHLKVRGHQKAYIVPRIPGAKRTVLVS